MHRALRQARGIVPRCPAATQSLRHHGGGELAELAECRPTYITQRYLLTSPSATYFHHPALPTYITQCYLLPSPSATYLHHPVLPISITQRVRKLASQQRAPLPAELQKAVQTLGSVETAAHQSALLTKQMAESGAQQGWLPS